MKFIVKKPVIYKCISHLQSIVDKKNTLPILSNILIEANDNQLTLSSTDMDISIKEKINCKIVEAGSITINAQMIYDVIRKLPENNEIELISNDGKILTLRSNVSKFSLACLPKEDFPIIEVNEKGNILNVNSKLFYDLINKTKFAISHEETRYFLNGLYFTSQKNNNGSNNLTFVGTDGHRLAKYTSTVLNSSQELNGVIIPKKTINELSKLLSESDKEIKINISPNKIIFFIDNLILISKLIDGTFPDYNRVIPKKNHNSLEVNRLELLSAVDRVSTITNEKSPVIKLKLLNNIINLSTINNENSTATEDLKVNYSGENIEIGFNVKYIMDILNNLEKDDIEIEFGDNSSPIIAKEKSNSDLVYVLMPMRV